MEANILYVKEIVRELESISEHSANGVTDRELDLRKLLGDYANGNLTTDDCYNSNIHIINAS